jgi:hypothetical protein
MGQAAGVAAAAALRSGVNVRDVDVPMVQRLLRAPGADPGDEQPVMRVPVAAAADQER